MLTLKPCAHCYGALQGSLVSCLPPPHEAGGKVARVSWIKARLHYVTETGRFFHLWVAILSREVLN